MNAIRRASAELAARLPAFRTCRTKARKRRNWTVCRDCTTGLTCGHRHTSREAAAECRFFTGANHAVEPSLQT